MLDAVLRIAGDWPAATFGVGVALLIVGGHWLVDGSVQLSRRLGVSTLMIGLTVVAFGTSAPELAFNVIAAIGGNPALSFGNVIGSNIANIAIVLGLAALLMPVAVARRVERVELPLLAATTAGCAVLAWLPFTRIAGDGEPAAGWSRLDGIVMLVVFAVIMAAWIRAGRRGGAEEHDGEGPLPSLPAAIALSFLGLATLVAGGKATEIGAVGIATSMGLSQGLIGLTIVAISTSLPEIVASAIAAKRGHSDLAIGNVVGSNLFNLLLVMGATAAIAPVPVPGREGWIDLVVCTVLTVALIPIVRTGPHCITRREGAVLLGAYVAYMTYRAIGEM